jgi:Cys-tRNA(Pro) deacylase
LGKYPTTPATLFLDEKDVEYTKHYYDYKKSGAALAAKSMKLDPSSVIKTLVMEDDENCPLLMLMHADREVSLKELARELDKRNISTCNIRDAQRYTGYRVGGISPFGTKRELPIYMEHSILDLPYIYINGGRRGFILGMSPKTIIKTLKVTVVKASR